MKRSFPIYCLFRLNVDDVKMMPFMPYITKTMRILGHKIFNRKLKINSMSIRTINVECIKTKKDHKCRYQKCDFPLFDLPQEFSCLTRNTIRDARNILQISVAKMHV